MDGSGICNSLAMPCTPAHVAGVRGSPVLRTFLLALALIGAGAGLMRLTAARADVRPAPPVADRTVSQPGTSPFRLLLSNPAAEVLLDTGSGEPLRVSTPASPLSGQLSLDPRNPHVAIIVRWVEPPAAGEHRFAKLTLERSGQATFTHVFDAAGDIDDFHELPLPAAP